MPFTRIRATDEERRRSLPGDAVVPDAMGTVTHAVTIAAPPERVWPWLAQMGGGRAGWYSWDFLDNAGRPSATEILPDLQRIAADDVLWVTLPAAALGHRIMQARQLRGIKRRAEA